MNASLVTKYRWFWPWQDEKEEKWLEEMSRAGWHLHEVHLLCSYTFARGEPVPYVYRLDYFSSSKSSFQEYQQIFQDAGWEYLGQLSNWRYWRKRPTGDDTPEIFTDRQSKLNKYRRMLGYMAFFLFFLIFMGWNVFRIGVGFDPEIPLLIATIHALIKLLYAVLILIYLVVVVKILLRIRQLKKAL